MKRYCCDHQCVQGRCCPSFAPGVIDGPYRNRQTVALKKWLVRCAVWMYLLAVVWLVVVGSGL